MVKITKAHAI